MNFVHFIFAFYVFLLVCGAIWLYGRVMRADKKKDKSSYEKEHRLFVMYQNVEDMLDSFEEYVEEAKSGIDGRLNQVEALIEKLRTEMENRPEPKTRQEESVPKPVPEDQEESAEKPVPAARQEESAAEPMPEEGQKGRVLKPAVEYKKEESMITPAPENEAYIKRPQKQNKSTSNKPKQKTPELIQQYIEEGMSKEEIAKALGISMREVSLIMEIKKIHV